MLAENHADVVTCQASPHIDTSANLEQYRIILDIPNPNVINDIEEACKKNKWSISYHPYSLIGE